MSYPPHGPALLNPQTDFSVARRVIERTRDMMQEKQEILLSTELTREEYLKAFSAALALRAAVDAMETEYNRAANK